MASPDPFIPRVLRSNRGTVAVQEPGGHDYFMLVRIGDDIRGLLPDAVEGKTFLPAELLMTHPGFWFVEMQPTMRWG